MSTRSIIAYQNASGIHAVYCHWDGYPAHNGHVLLTAYTDEAKVQALIALGAISLLAKELEPPTGEEHSFEAPLPDVTIAYHRDRNEPWEYTHPHTYNDAEALFSDTDSYGAEYIYLFNEGTWRWTPCLQAKPNWRVLTAEDCE
jgi:hypothetical protein